jgi:exodeoxyribonuclease-3
VLARAGLGLEHAATGLPGEVRPEEARWVEAHIPGLGVRVASAYVVNGREVGSTTFDEKLRFLEAMGARAADIAGEPLIVGGDFNVAPEDVDVYDPAAFVGATHVTEDERGRLRDVLERGGLVDAYRALDPDGVHHTWWDYRGGSFHRGLGLRIDLLLVSRDLAPRLRACGIARELRKGEKPSDHAPLVADLDNG